MIAFILWVAFSIVIGVAANARGRNGFGWFLLSLLISPLLAAFALFVLPTYLGDVRKCPACAELVKLEAKVCKHCGYRLPPPLLELKAIKVRRIRARDREAIIAAAVVIAVGLFIVLAVATKGRAEEQTRFYDARGNNVGTAVPQGEGSTRYYDAQGKSLGTSTTTHGTTTFYGPGGNVTGRTFRGERR